MNPFIAALTKEILPQLVQALLTSLASAPITIQALQVTALGAHISIGPIPIRVTAGQPAASTAAPVNTPAAAPRPAGT